MTESATVRPSAATKRCTNCKEEKSLCEFGPHRKKYLRSSCKLCDAKRSKRYQDDDPERKREQRIRSYHKHKSGHVAYQKENAQRHYDAKRAGYLVHQAKKRAKLKGLPFSLDIRDIQQRIDNGVCEISGVSFDLLSRRGPYAPSLDRKVLSLGYTTENTRVVCWGLNAAFGPWGESVTLHILTTWQKRLGVFA